MKFKMNKIRKIIVFGVVFVSIFDYIFVNKICLPSFPNLDAPMAMLVHYSVGALVGFLIFCILSLLIDLWCRE